MLELKHSLEVVIQADALQLFGEVRPHIRPYIMEFARNGSDEVEVAADDVLRDVSYSFYTRRIISMVV